MACIIVLALFALNKKWVVYALEALYALALVTRPSIPLNTVVITASSRCLLVCSPALISSQTPGPPASKLEALYALALLYHVFILHTISFDMEFQDGIRLGLGAAVTFCGAALAGYWV